MSCALFLDNSYIFVIYPVQAEFLIFPPNCPCQLRAAVYFYLGSVSHTIRPTKIQHFPAPPPPHSHTSCFACLESLSHHKHLKIKGKLNSNSVLRGLNALGDACLLPSGGHFSYCCRSKEKMAFARHLHKKRIAVLNTVLRTVFAQNLHVHVI